MPAWSQYLGLDTSEVGNDVLLICLDGMCLFTINFHIWEIKWNQNRIQKFTLNILIWFISEPFKIVTCQQACDRLIRSIKVYLPLPILLCMFTTFTWTLPLAEIEPIVVVPVWNWVHNAKTIYKWTSLRDINVVDIKRLFLVSWFDSI